MWVAIVEFGIPVDRGWATDERVIMEGAAAVVDVIEVDTIEVDTIEVDTIEVDTIEVDTIEVDTGGAAYEVAMG